MFFSPFTRSVPALFLDYLAVNWPVQIPVLAFIPEVSTVFCNSLVPSISQVLTVLITVLIVVFYTAE